jgi:hypothetical protein
MIPVFEQGKGEGIGHSYHHFLNHFLNICNDHIENDRAKSFAFILYNFYDDHIRTILKKQGVFAELDRLSGNELSIFYLNSDEQDLIESFNTIFLGAFEVEDKLKKPFVLFFKIYGNEVEDVVIVELEQSDLTFAFKELYDIIQKYLARRVKNRKQIKSKISKIGPLFSSINRIALEKLIERLIENGADKIKHW